LLYKGPFMRRPIEMAFRSRVSISSMQPHGDSVLFQYFFWLYSHPPVYIMSLGLILTGGLSFWKRRSLSL
jgi:hypothetical protein